MTEPTHFQLVHWKFKRSVSAPKCQFSPAGQSLIQPLLEPFEHNLSQNCPIKSLFQPWLGFISALLSKSALGNRTVFTLIKCHIRPKDRTVFCSPKRPQLAPFLRLKQIFLVYSVCKLCVRTLHTVFSMSNFVTTSTSKFYCLFQSLERRKRGSWGTFSQFLLGEKIIQRGVSD